MARIARLDEAEPFVAPDASLIRELAGPGRPASAANQSLAEATVAPGGETAEHYHGRAEELYLFTSGSGRLRLGEVERDVRAGDCAAIPPGTRHKLWNTSSDAPLVLLCCSAPAYSDEDTFLTEPSEPAA
jgi:mannose-6-phosphate isomerase-like protein (cupin superfamily)